LDNARKYLSLGDYLWNGGMFIWKSFNVIGLCKDHLKNTFDILNEVMA